MSYFPSDSLREPLVRQRSAPPQGTRRRGTAAVEFAIAAPVLFMMIFSSIEFGRMAMVRNLMNDAAHSGCRAGCLADASSSQISTQVTNTLSNTGTCPTCATTTVYVNGQLANASTAIRGDLITVQVSVPAEMVSWGTNWWLGGKTFRGQATIRRE